MKLHINKTLLALVLSGMVGAMGVTMAADLDLTGSTKERTWAASDGSNHRVDGKILMTEGSKIVVKAANSITLTATDGIELAKTDGSTGFATINSTNGNNGVIVAKITGEINELRYTGNAKTMRGWQESDYVGTTNIQATTTFDAQGSLNEGGELHAWGANGNTVNFSQNASFTGLTAGQDYSVGQNLYTVGGARTLNFGTGNITFDGSVNASGGNLTLSGAQRLALGETGSINISESNTLTLNSSLYASVADLSKISNSGTLTFRSGSYLILSDATDGSTFHIGNVTNAASVISTGDRAMVADYDAATGDVTILQVSDEAIIPALSTTWKGAAGNTTWNTSASNKTWQGGSYDSTFFVNNDSVTFAAAESKDVTVDGNVTVVDMAVNASGYTFSSDNGGAITVTGKLETASGSDIDITITTDFVSTGVTQTGVNDPQGLHLLRGTLTFGDGTTAGVADVKRIEMGDAQAGTSVLNVKKNYVLKVTGDVCRTSGDNTYKDASLLLGEWKMKTSVNVDGTFLAKDAILALGDMGADIVLGEGAVATIKGVKRLNTAKHPNLSLQMAEGSLFLLGSEGINTFGNNAMTSDLQGGTIGAYAASTTINHGLTLNGTVTFDTTTYAYSDDGNSVARSTAADKASTITVTGALGGTGALNVTGEGTLALTSAGNRDITVEGATLSVTNGVEVGDGKTLTATGSASISGNVTIDGNGTLTIGAPADGAPALTVSGTLTFEDNAKLNLTGLNITAQDTQETYTLVSGLDSIVKNGGLVLEGFNVGDRTWSLQTAGGTVLLSGGNVGQIVSGQMLSMGSDALQLIVAGVPPTLTATNVIGATYDPDAAGGAVLTLTTEIPSGADIGSTLDVTFENEPLWQSVVDSGNIYQDALVQIADANGTVLDMTGITVSVNGVVLDSEGKAFVAYIPEPATGTLSVLALAALALRRRRK